MSTYLHIVGHVVDWHYLIGQSKSQYTFDQSDIHTGIDHYLQQYSLNCRHKDQYSGISLKQKKYVALITTNNIPIGTHFSLPCHANATAILLIFSYQNIPITQVLLSLPNTKPVWHSHMKLPSVFIQTWLQDDEVSLHSSISIYIYIYIYIYMCVCVCV